MFSKASSNAHLLSSMELGKTVKSENVDHSKDALSFESVNKEEKTINFKELLTKYR